MLYYLEPLGKPGLEDLCAIVIRADSFTEARRIAAIDTLGSNRADFLDQKKTSCTALDSEGRTEIICSDIWEA